MTCRPALAPGPSKSCAFMTHVCLPGVSSLRPSEGKGSPHSTVEEAETRLLTPDPALSGGPRLGLPPHPYTLPPLAL